MALPEPVLSAALEFARETSTHVVTVVCDRLERAPDIVSAGLSPDASRRLDALLVAWRQHSPGISGREISNVLGTLHFAIRTEAASRRTELVWTGPAHIGTPLRSTEPALLELIDSARRSLYVVTFAAYRVPAIAAAISRAIARGVRVAFVLETDTADGGKVAFDPLPYLCLSDAPRAQCTHGRTSYERAMQTDGMARSTQNLSSPIATVCSYRAPT